MKIIEPLNFYGEGSRKEMNSCDDFVANNQISNQKQIQMDVWGAYQGKIFYEMKKRELDMEKNYIMQQQKVKMEEDLCELRVRYKCFMSMISSTVYRDSNGNIIYAITAPDGKKINAKVLLNVKKFRSRILVTYYPQARMVLDVWWGEGGESHVYFSYGKDGISPNVFLKTLKAKGVLLLVSGRTEHQAANALLAFTFNDAEVEEIPLAYGWGKNAEGKWHFAGEDEITLKEVLKNAIG